MFGPVFAREAATSPRRPRHFLQRGIYLTAVLVLMCTAWLLLTGAQLIRNVGDMSRFGAILFQILSPIQLALLTFLAAFGAASAVSQEKDKRTLLLLLLTRMRNHELVLGKMLASSLNVLVMLAASFPVFLAITLFGGVSTSQVVSVFAVTLTTVLAAGSLGVLVAFWREKTFQTLALTAVMLLMWLGLWEAVQLNLFGTEILGLQSQAWAEAFSPIRAIHAAARPELNPTWFVSQSTLTYLICSLLGAALLNGVAVAFVRVWNPSREVRPGQANEEGESSIWGPADDGKVSSASDSEGQRSGHVDARVRAASSDSRRVWDNPVLWREVCTWAYGRKVLIIRFVYLVLFAMVAAALLLPQAGPDIATGLSSIVPRSAQPLAPFLLVSLVIVNALAVTSITNERDGQALDLLLVTDLSPREFVFGKLLGVFWVTKEMIVLPILLCITLWWQERIGGENLILLIGGLLTMNGFAAMLGVHCGMTYANSRTSIGASLGTLFFLFLGVVTLMAMMISFSGSFQTQLTPFLAFILGGSVGLYAALGSRNLSQAILLAALMLPIATFYSITSFLLDHMMAVFLVTVGTYGFTIAAMLMPAIGEFDIAMGRTKTAEEE